MLLAMVLIAAAIGSCKHELPTTGTIPPDPPPVGDTTTSCDPNKIYFQQQVLPILVSNCAKSGCHDNASHQDGVILTSYSSVITTADVQLVGI